MRNSPSRACDGRIDRRQDPQVMAVKDIRPRYLDGLTKPAPHFWGVPEFLRQVPDGKRTVLRGDQVLVGATQRQQVDTMAQVSQGLAKPRNAVGWATGIGFDVSSEMRDQHRLHVTTT